MNNDFHILLDVEMQADLEIKVRRPDMIATDKKNNVCKIIDLHIQHSTYPIYIYTCPYIFRPFTPLQLIPQQHVKLFFLTGK